MGLKQQLRDDLTAAMKARDELTKSTLRMALTAITAAEVAGDTARELDEVEVLKVLTKEAKKREESATVFEQNGRTELAEKERAEGEVLARYLPKQLTDDEILAICEAAVAEVTVNTGAKPGPKQMGQVMKLANAEIAGRADGSRVAPVVKKLLQEPVGGTP
jgi:uncharacterized protein YqeY